MAVRIFLRGGLGNQLFQYASAYTLSQRLNTELILDCSLLPLVEDRLKGISRWPEQISSFHYVGTLEKKRFQPEGRTSMYSKMVSARVLLMSRLSSSETLRLNFVTDNNIRDLNRMFAERTGELDRSPKLTMFGYFQDERIFEKYQDYLCSQISAIQRPSLDYRRAKSSIKSESTAVHARLGDKAKLSPEYKANLFRKLNFALSSLDEKTNKILIYTDSMEEFRREKLQGTFDYELVDTRNCSPLETMNLMAISKTIVGSDSTFFWWVSKMQKHNSPDGVVINY